MAPGLAFHHSHARTVGWAASDAGLDGADAPRRHAPDEGEIGPLEPAVGAVGGELLGQALMGGVVLGDDEQARCLLVEAVDDARSLDATDARQAVAAVGDQRIDERAVGVAGGGVHDEARRLVDDDEVVVLVGDRERDRLALRLGRLRRRQLHSEYLGWFDPQARVTYGSSRSPYMPGPDQSLDARAAYVGKKFGEHPVQALSRMLGTHGHGCLSCSAGGGFSRSSGHGFPRPVPEPAMSPLPQSSRHDDEADAAAQPNPKVQRALVFVVVILGLLIVAGLVAVIGRVLYLSSRSAAQPEASSGRMGGEAPRLIADVPLPLPPGAQVKSTALSGNRLAVHYEGPDGAAIVIVDLDSKSIIARVKIGRDYLER